MKLSEAIRLGAMLKPQGKGNTSALRGAAGTCALGAAGDAIGKWFDGDTYEPLRQFWPILRTIVPNPLFPNQSFVVGVIVELNDSHNWTREQIADWVATIEAQHPGMHSETVPASAVETLAEAIA